MLLCVSLVRGSRQSSSVLGQVFIAMQQDALVNHDQVIAPGQNYLHQEKITEEWLKGGQHWFL